MPAIGMGMLWGGYTLMFWGYCKLRGYDIGLAEIVIPKRWNGKWPPPLVDDSSPSGPMGGQLGGGPGNPSTGGNGVAPGDHPGDMPWTYPPNTSGASAPSGGSSSIGGVIPI